MAPSNFANFFLAATGAGGALIGLLFVAISVRPGLVARRATHPAVQLSVAMAFTALVNGFFIAFVALLPGTVLGGVALLMGAVSSWSCLSAAIGLVRHLRELRHMTGERTLRFGRQLARGLILVAVGLVIYGWEIAAGWQAVRGPKDVGPVWIIANLVIAAFALGLVRAWELLGMHRGSGLLRWLSPLGDEGAAGDDELPPASTPEETHPHPIGTGTTTHDTTHDATRDATRDATHDATHDTETQSHQIR